MSNYTIILHKLITNEYDLGLESYPIFNEAYRENLNNKILNHFKYREIGFETPALFKHFLNVKMNEIMSYYNKMYSSELLKFEPLYNVDITTESEATGENTNNVTSSSNGNSKNIFSDAPQGLLSIGNLQGNLFATTADLVENIGGTTESGNLNNTMNSTSHTYGNNGGLSNSELLIKFRETFLNIDMLVINELNDLFLGVY